jgi:LysM repeat protein
LGGRSNPPEDLYRRDFLVRWKRLFYYLTINVLVSACTVVAVLTLWESYRPAVPLDVSWQSPRETIAASVATMFVPVSIETDPAESLQPTPTRALATYRVVAGDTLSEIAARFEVAVEELIELNPGISDPHALGSGQVIFVPALPPDGEPLPEESRTPPAPQPQEVDGVRQVVIASVIGAGDLPTERVRLEHTGGNEVILSGWSLKDEDGNIFLFPYLSLFTGGVIDVYSKGGANSVDALYWGLDQPVWETGETVTLLDRQGAVRSLYKVP